MSLPAWWSDAEAKRRQNATSRAQERRLARDTGGRPQAGSGSSRRAPQDVKTDDGRLLQHKGTKAGSYRVSLDEMDHIIRDAILHGREGGLVIEFTGTGRRFLVTEMED